MKTRHLLMACALPALFAACKKDSNDKPATPTVADNTVAFTLDGKAYTTTGLELSTAAVPDQEVNQTDSLYVLTGITSAAANAGQITLSVTFRKGQVAAGNYGDTAYATDGINWVPALGGEDFYQSNTSHYSVIQVSKADGKVLEGTFSGEVASTTNQDQVLKVTGGQFRINLATVAKGN